MPLNFARYFAPAACAAAALLAAPRIDAAAMQSASARGEASTSPEIEAGGALDGVRHRVLVSTDIGGTDPDDFQSMVHLLLYADVPNWWTDDPAPSAAEGVHHGARSVNCWREAYLADFARRMDRVRRQVDGGPGTPR